MGGFIFKWGKVPHGWETSSDGGVFKKIVGLGGMGCTHSSLWETLRSDDKIVIIHYQMKKKHSLRKLVHEFSKKG